MTTAKRRRGHSLHLDLPNTPLDELPPIAALFLVHFDVKAGYTIAWKRHIPGLQLADSVEFKSLPSGLHNISEDLIYFVHDNEYAGISAFINKPAAESERNALMLAVGALVPLSDGRLGRSWKHAEGLKELALELVQNYTETRPLEDFWSAHSCQNEDDVQESDRSQEDDGLRKARELRSPNEPVARHTRDRTLSTASGLVPSGQQLSPYHPALSLPSFLDTFGPLIFPLYKAALLRKRILLLTQAPVELACNYAYDLSILSSIPSSISDLIPLEPLPARLEALFSVGVHDIYTLMQGSRSNGKGKDAFMDDTGYGWVACTTDDILAMKADLYDILVTIPPSYTEQAVEKVWPKVTMEPGTDIKATQRDLRRYRTLRRGLHRFPGRSRGQSPYSVPLSTNAGMDEQTVLLPVENAQETFDDASSTSDEKLVEPLSWSALAYSSFMWWASAGEQRTDLDEESEYDAALLHGFTDLQDASPGRPRSRPRSGSMAPVGVEMAMIAYFHRLTTLIFKTLTDLVEASDDVAQGDEQQGTNDEAGDKIFIKNEDIARMGLDTWSEGDRRFVQELIELYWGRKSEVQGRRVECCGVRIC